MLITPAYQREQRRMHSNKRYGAASRKFAPLVLEIIKELQPQSILDYGAGKCALRESLGKEIAGIYFAEYDPGIKGISRFPRRKFDLVCCVDVLEHIEPKCIKDVLASIREKTLSVAFLTIHTGPAGKYLSDGRNAHLIQKPVEWWAALLGNYFDSVEYRMENETTGIAICKVNK